jgi:formylglycine-generating enzyme required for sulfatase activity
VKLVHFELQIDGGPETYRVKVAGVPATHTFRSPLSPAELAGFWSWLSAGDRGSRNFEPEPAEGDPAREIGARLFRALFVGDVRIALERAAARARSRRSRLRLRLSFAAPELTALPWELLYDPEKEEFLFWSHHNSLLRSVDTQAERRPLLVDSPLRMLILSSRPEDKPRLALDEEVAMIRSALSGLTDAKRLTIDWIDRPTLPQLAEHLDEHECHIVHFLGHGGFDESEGGALLFEEESGAHRPVRHDILGELLDHEPLRLVVLNACEGARGSVERPFSGVAQRLAKRGVPAVIAMQCPVDDRMAVEFAWYFYRALAKNGRPGQSLAEARRALLTRGYQKGWCIPALYLQAEDGELLRTRDAALRMWAKAGAGLAALALAAAVALRVNDAPPPVPSAECPSPPGLEMLFRRISPGTFKMGGTQKPAKPVHQVILTRPFCLGIYEVTQKQWEAVMHSNPSEKIGPDLPVQRVSWNDAQAFITALNVLDAQGHYRLPSEAEWEYAARAGNTSAKARDLSKYGNCGDGEDGFESISPVGSFRPNRWGLYDMVGNVSEWVGDWSSEAYEAGTATNPTGPATGTRRVRRGGSFDVKVCNAVARNKTEPDQGPSDVGLRVVRAPVR